VSLEQNSIPEALQVLVNIQTYFLLKIKIRNLKLNYLFASAYTDLKSIIYFNISHNFVSGTFPSRNIFSVLVPSMITSIAI